ncbi:MAG: hypothetical protein IKG67_04870 [Parasporobacterium sp.]|nr:hypothetical protein [Parasporobacterium sp.]
MTTDKRKLSTEEYQRKLNAAGTIIRFMGGLATRYTSVQMHYLWQCMEVMRARYGDIFVADAINKDIIDAEWALWRYGIQERKALK